MRSADSGTMSGTGADLMTRFSLESLIPPRWRAFLTLAPTDLLRDAVYRRLWTSILISSFGGQVTLLALPLTAAFLLHASPTEMGILTAIEIAPFVLFSLPSGVWLDRVRKMPVYVVGELTIACAVATVPCAWWFGRLSMGWLYFVAFVIGSVNTTAGSAAQIVLTQIVPRSAARRGARQECVGFVDRRGDRPGSGGRLDQDRGRAGCAARRCAAAAGLGIDIARRARARDAEREATPPFWPAMRAGLNFVRGHKLLVAMASCVGVWQMCNQMAMVVQILFATRELGLSERAVGLSYVGLGLGTIGASIIGQRVVRRIGSGTDADARVCGHRHRLAAAQRGADQCVSASPRTSRC